MIIFRNLSKELYVYLLGITMVLLVIFLTNQFEHYMKYAARGEVTMSAVMALMTLQIPLLLGYLLPLSLYIAILLVLGRMYMDSEMTVLYACGFSRLKLLGMVMIVATALATLVAVIMIWAQPIMENYRVHIVRESVANASIEKITPHRFQTFGNKGMFYANAVSHHHRALHDVFLALRNHNAWDITVAQHATEVKRPNNGRFLVFNQGSRYVGMPGQSDFKIFDFAQYGMLLQDVMPPINDWPRNVSSAVLWREAPHNLRAAATLQWRMAMPISVFILTLLAVPLSEVKPRQGRFARLIPAIVIYFVYADLTFMARVWIRKGVISPDLGMWWLHGVMLVLAVVLWARHFKWVKRYAHR